jgi:hypothetical protein
MGFGFPNERHLRLAVKLGIGWRIGEVHQLNWYINADAQVASLGWLWQDELLVANSSSLQNTVAGAWTRMQQSADSLKYSLGQRDWAQFEWRYLKRPDKQYQFIALKRPWSSECIGVAVVSAPAAPGAAMLWVDWIGSTALISLGHRMVMKLAHAQQASCVTSWASAEVENALAQTSIDLIETCAVMGVPIASNLTAEEAQHLRWWAMAGDTDFL